MRVRRALNVESGLNDGIVTAVVAFTLALAAAALGTAAHADTSGGGAVADLAVGLAVGVAVGLGAAVLVTIGSRRHWIIVGGRRLATLAAALSSFALAVAVGRQRLHRRLRRRHRLRGRSRHEGRRRRARRRAAGAPRRGDGPRRLVPVRSRRWCPWPSHNFERRDAGLRPAEPDPGAHGTRRAGPGRVRSGPAHRAVRRLVRTTRARLGRLRPAGGRGARRDAAWSTSLSAPWRSRCCSAWCSTGSPPAPWRVRFVQLEAEADDDVRSPRSRRAGQKLGGSE